MTSSYNLFNTKIKIENNNDNAFINKLGKSMLLQALYDWSLDILQQPLSPNQISKWRNF